MKKKRYVLLFMLGFLIGSIMSGCDYSMFHDMDDPNNEAEMQEVCYQPRP